MVLPVAGWLGLGVVSIIGGYAATKSTSKAQARVIAQQRQLQLQQEAEHIIAELGITVGDINEEQLRCFAQGQGSDSGLMQQLADYANLNVQSLPALAALLANGQVSNSDALQQRMEAMQQQRHELAFLTSIAHQY